MCSEQSISFPLNRDKPLDYVHVAPVVDLLWINGFSPILLVLVCRYLPASKCFRAIYRNLSDTTYRSNLCYDKLLEDRHKAAENTSTNMLRQLHDTMSLLCSH